ncbi:hypothetical protein CYMTET_33125 [Cymbomonas tetramitiformis]|uniref:Radical SAM core domain-containing protein n=1 Tax=Cymbomonas tetramitiformis TaxID=36881 RepID=A0AAE0FDM2_9CHLO|nr:hypothetical protein CYMTET_33125 [Cymbomonas tetramitiformis]
MRILCTLAVENEGPTDVPRPKGVTDGKWDKVDQQQVTAALKNADATASTLKLALSGGKGALLGLTQEELETIAVEHGEKKYRGKQIYDALYKRGAREIDDFKQLPKSFRELLAQSGLYVGRSEVHHVAKAKDGTAKLLIKLSDNRIVETVGIPATKAQNPRLTVCVSSQGKGGFARNLKANEIVDQVLAVQEYFGQRVTHIVFMGMGEPLLNLPSVIAAHRCLNQEVGIGARNMTISTVGVPNAIMKLAKHKIQSTLAVSLHAPNQDLRIQLIPSAKVYPIEALLMDCQAYFNYTKRRVSFEYTLLAGVNDSRDDARELGQLLRKYGLAGHVNIIPYNPVDGAPYDRPTKRGVEEFKQELEKYKMEVTVRETRGLEAAAACGQLRNAFQKTPLEEGASAALSGAAS